MSKVCTKCLVEYVDVDGNFNKCKKVKSGLHSWCKQCVKQYRSKYHSENKKELNEKRREYRSENKEIVREQEQKQRSKDRQKYNQMRMNWTIKNPEKVLLIKARERVKLKNLEMDITENDIIIPDLCPMLGIPLISHRGKGIQSDNSPSLDRIDPKLGYIKGNIHVISVRANKIKNDATTEELGLIYEYLKSLEKAA
ncbi:hypothetical protein NUACC26_085400 [Scytonema sp. NUACC26]